MSDKNKEIPTLPINKTQKRLYAAASDPTFEHETFKDMEEYLKNNPTAYLGQLLYCKAHDSHYRIAKNSDGQKILEGIGASMIAENVSYKNDKFPELTNLKRAIDYILEELGKKSEQSFAESNEVYFGVSTLDGITDELSKEMIVSNFNRQLIEEPDESADIDVAREYKHVKIDFGIHEQPQYFYVAIPIKHNKIKARDLSSMFGDGWFNWNQEETSNFLKTITLPDANGYLQEYILMRSDNMLLDGSNWLFYFKDK